MKATNYLALLMVPSLMAQAPASSTKSSVTFRDVSSHSNRERVVFKPSTGSASPEAKASSVLSGESDSQLENSYMTSALGQLEELEHLERGWYDGEVGEPIHDAVIAGTRSVLAAIAGLPETYIYPTVSGGVALEWDHEGDTLRITIEHETTTFTFLAADRSQRKRQTMDTGCDLRASISEFFAALRREDVQRVG